MEQKTSTLHWIEEIISEDHRGLEIAIKQWLGNHHEKKQEKD